MLGVFRASPHPDEHIDRSPACFLRDERGSATVEFTIWVPAFGAILALVAEFAFAFMAHANMWDAARDGARRMAIGQMNASQAQAHVEHRIVRTNRSARVTTVDGDEVVVEVTAPIDDVTPLGFFDRITNGDLQVRVTMLKEPI